MLTVKSIDPDLHFAEDNSNELKVDNNVIEDSDSNAKREFDLIQGLFNRKRKNYHFNSWNM